MVSVNDDDELGQDSKLDMPESTRDASGTDDIRRKGMAGPLAASESTDEKISSAGLRASRPSQAAEDREQHIEGPDSSFEPPQAAQDSPTAAEQSADESEETAGIPVVSADDPAQKPPVDKGTTDHVAADPVDDTQRGKPTPPGPGAPDGPDNPWGQFIDPQEPDGEFTARRLVWMRSADTDSGARAVDVSFTTDPSAPHALTELKEQLAFTRLSWEQHADTHQEPRDNLTSGHALRAAQSATNVAEFFHAMDGFAAALDQETHPELTDLLATITPKFPAEPEQRKQIISQFQQRAMQVTQQLTSGYGSGNVDDVQAALAAGVQLIASAADGADPSVGDLRQLQDIVVLTATELTTLPAGREHSDELGALRQTVTEFVESYTQAFKTTEPVNRRAWAAHFKPETELARLADAAGGPHPLSGTQSSTFRRQARNHFGAEFRDSELALYTDLTRWLLDVAQSGERINIEEALSAAELGIELACDNIALFDAAVSTRADFDATALVKLARSPHRAAQLAYQFTRIATLLPEAPTFIHRMTTYAEELAARSGAALGVAELALQSPQHHAALLAVLRDQAAELRDLYGPTAQRKNVIGRLNRLAYYFGGTQPLLERPGTTPDIATKIATDAWRGQANAIPTIDAQFQPVVECFREGVRLISQADDARSTTLAADLRPLTPLLQAHAYRTLPWQPINELIEKVATGTIDTDDRAKLTAVASRLGSISSQLPGDPWAPFIVNDATPQPFTAVRHTWMRTASGELTVIPISLTVDPAGDITTQVQDQLREQVGPALADHASGTADSQRSAASFTNCMSKTSQVAMFTTVDMLLADVQAETSPELTAALANQDATLGDEPTSTTVVTQLNERAQTLVAHLNTLPALDPDTRAAARTLLLQAIDVTVKAADLSPGSEQRVHSLCDATIALAHAVTNAQQRGDEHTADDLTDFVAELRGFASSFSHLTELQRDDTPTNRTAAARSFHDAAGAGIAGFTGAAGDGHARPLLGNDVQPPFNVVARSRLGTDHRELDLNGWHHAQNLLFGPTADVLGAQPTQRYARHAALGVEIGVDQLARLHAALNTEPLNAALISDAAAVATRHLAAVADAVQQLGEHVEENTTNTLLKLGGRCAEITGLFTAIDELDPQQRHPLAQLLVLEQVALAEQLADWYDIRNQHAGAANIIATLDRLATQTEPMTIDNELDGNSETLTAASDQAHNLTRANFLNELTANETGLPAIVWANGVARHQRFPLTEAGSTQFAAAFAQWEFLDNGLDQPIVEPAIVEATNAMAELHANGQLTQTELTTQLATIGDTLMATVLRATASVDADQQPRHDRALVESVAWSAFDHLFNQAAKANFDQQWIQNLILRSPNTAAMVCVCINGGLVRPFQAPNRVIQPGEDPVTLERQRTAFTLELWDQVRNLALEGTQYPETPAAAVVQAHNQATELLGHVARSPELPPVAPAPGLTVASRISRIGLGADGIRVAKSSGWEFFDDTSIALTAMRAESTAMEDYYLDAIGAQPDPTSLLNAEFFTTLVEDALRPGQLLRQEHGNLAPAEQLNDAVNEVANLLDRRAAALATVALLDTDTERGRRHLDALDVAIHRQTIAEAAERLPSLVTILNDVRAGRSIAAIPAETRIDYAQPLAGTQLDDVDELRAFGAELRQTVALNPPIPETIFTENRDRKNAVGALATEVTEVNLGDGQTLRLPTGFEFPAGGRVNPDEATAVVIEAIIADAQRELTVRRLDTRECAAANATLTVARNAIQSGDLTTAQEVLARLPGPSDDEVAVSDAGSDPRDVIATDPAGGGAGAGGVGADQLSADDDDDEPQLWFAQLKPGHQLEWQRRPLHAAETITAATAAIRTWGRHPQLRNKEGFATLIQQLEARLSLELPSPLILAERARNATDAEEATTLHAEAERIGNGIVDQAQFEILSFAHKNLTDQELIDFGAGFLEDWRPALAIGETSQLIIAAPRATAFALFCAEHTIPGGGLPAGHEAAEIHSAFVAKLTELATQPPTPLAVRQVIAEASAQLRTSRFGPFSPDAVPTELLDDPQIQVLDLPIQEPDGTVKIHRVAQRFPTFDGRRTVEQDLVQARIQCAAVTELLAAQQLPANHPAMRALTACQRDLDEGDTLEFINHTTLLQQYLIEQTAHDPQSRPAFIAAAEELLATAPAGKLTTRSIAAMLDTALNAEVTQLATLAEGDELERSRCLEALDELHAFDQIVQQAEAAEATTPAERATATARARSVAMRDSALTRARNPAEAPTVDAVALQLADAQKVGFDTRDADVIMAPFTCLERIPATAKPPGLQVNVQPAGLFFRADDPPDVTAILLISQLNQIQHEILQQVDLAGRSVVGQERESPRDEFGDRLLDRNNRPLHGDELLQHTVTRLALGLRPLLESQAGQSPTMAELLRDGNTEELVPAIVRALATVEELNSQIIEFLSYPHVLPNDRHVLPHNSPDPAERGRAGLAHLLHTQLLPELANGTLPEHRLADDRKRNQQIIIEFANLLERAANEPEAGGDADLTPWAHEPAPGRGTIRPTRAVAVAMLDDLNELCDRLSQTQLADLIPAREALTQVTPVLAQTRQRLLAGAGSLTQAERGELARLGGTLIDHNPFAALTPTTAADRFLHKAPNDVLFAGENLGGRTVIFGLADGECGAATTSIGELLRGEPEALACLTQADALAEQLAQRFATAHPDWTAQGTLLQTGILRERIDLAVAALRTSPDPLDAVHEVRRVIDEFNMAAARVAHHHGEREWAVGLGRGINDRLTELASTDLSRSPQTLNALRALQQRHGTLSELHQNDAVATMLEPAPAEPSLLDQPVLHTELAASNLGAPTIWPQLQHDWEPTAAFDHPARAERRRVGADAVHIAARWLAMERGQESAVCFAFPEHARSIMHHLDLTLVEVPKADGSPMLLPLVAGVVLPLNHPLRNEVDPTAPVTAHRDIVRGGLLAAQQIIDAELAAAANIVEKVRTDLLAKDADADAIIDVHPQARTAANTIIELRTLREHLDLLQLRLADAPADMPTLAPSTSNTVAQLRSIPTAVVTARSWSHATETQIGDRLNALDAIVARYGAYERASTSVPEIADEDVLVARHRTEHGMTPVFWLHAQECNNLIGTIWGDREQLGRVAIDPKTDAIANPNLEQLWQATNAFLAFAGPVLAATEPIGQQVELPEHELFNAGDDLAEVLAEIIGRRHITPLEPGTEMRLNDANDDERTRITAAIGRFFATTADLPAPRRDWLLGPDTPTWLINGDDDDPGPLGAIPENPIAPGGAPIDATSPDEEVPSPGAAGASDDDTAAPDDDSDPDHRPDARSRLRAQRRRPVSGGAATTFSLTRALDHSATLAKHRRARSMSDATGGAATTVQVPSTSVSSDGTYTFNNASGAPRPPAQPARSRALPTNARRDLLTASSTGTRAGVQ